MKDVVVPEAVAQLAGLVGSDGDDIIATMDERADSDGFPTVGPEVGGWLELLARVSDAQRVFEFGSGFGYSAYWFARGLPADGEVVLTEIDEDELDLAREYFEAGGFAELAQFEHGDALDIVERYDGPFDIVLIDNEKHRYVDAFEAIRGKLRPGSLVVADNAITAGTVVNRDEVVSLLAGERSDGDVEEDAISEGSRGIARYLEHVRTQDDVDTVLLPLGEGLAVSLVRG